MGRVYRGSQRRPVNLGASRIGLQPACSLTKWLLAVRFISVTEHPGYRPISTAVDFTLLPQYILRRDHPRPAGRRRKSGTGDFAGRLRG